MLPRGARHDKKRSSSLSPRSERVPGGWQAGLAIAGELAAAKTCLAQQGQDLGRREQTLAVHFLGAPVGATAAAERRDRARQKAVLFLRGDEHGPVVSLAKRLF